MLTGIRSLVASAVLLLVPAMLAGCVPFATKTDDWLTANTAPGAPEIDVTGYWSNGDWGDSYLMQKGGKVSGTLGGYPVRGVINRRAVHLVIYSKAQSFPNYTALLWLEEPDVLVGSWLRRGIVRVRGDGEVLILRRVANQSPAGEP